jgi:thioredoxin-dependent peroxiredoxin
MSTLKRGDAAPDFSLPSTRGPQTLEGYRGEWLVLYFYPKDDTPGCTAQACDLRDALPGLPARVLGISPDDLASHDAFEAKYNLPFPLASDPDNAVAKAYGAFGEKQAYGKTYEGVLRSTFLIDPEGKVAEAMYNVSAKAHAERVREALTQLQAA